MEGNSPNEVTNELGMSGRQKMTLLIYFSIIIIISIITIAYVWHPEPLTSSPNTNNQTLEPKNLNQSNLTNVFDASKTKTLQDNTPDLEINLLIVSALFGILGSSLHAISSLTVWIANKKDKKSWTLWYFTRPLVGASLAVIVYVMFRAGLVTGVDHINYFGIAAISSLAGLMSTVVTQKIRDLLDTLFPGKKTEEDKGDIPNKSLEANIVLTIPKTQIKIGEELECLSKISNAYGKPVENIPTYFSISNSNIAEFIPPTITSVNTTSDGIAKIKIKAKSIGEISLTAMAKIRNEEHKMIEELKVVDVAIIEVVE